MATPGFDYVALTSRSMSPTTPRVESWTASANLSRVVVMAATQMPVHVEDPILVHIRLFLTVAHLFLVALGTLNLLVIFLIALRPYMRSITNVYMFSLCAADFMYLANLLLVAATQLNDKSWPFNSTICTLYHGTETTGKYASVMFVVLLASDRFCAMCKPNFCARYRNYRVALGLSLLAWVFAIGSAFPLFMYSSVASAPHRMTRDLHRLCIIKWPSFESARWYITFSSVLIFVLPLALILFFYYHILSTLRQALKGHKRMRRATSATRAPYHRVTRLVLWVVIFHVLCWSPFWLFNLFSSIFQWRISTQFDRIVLNVIHLFPYLNCAANPLVYAVNAENFRRAFRSLFCNVEKSEGRGDGRVDDSRFHQNGAISTRSVNLGSTMNNSAERLLGINYSSTVVGQCSTSSLLNGAVFIPQIAGPPVSLRTGGSSMRGTDRLDEMRHTGTVVRFATIESESELEGVDDEMNAETEESTEIVGVSPDPHELEMKSTMVWDSTVGSNRNSSLGDVFM